MIIYGICLICGAWNYVTHVCVYGIYPTCGDWNYVYTCVWYISYIWSLELCIYICVCLVYILYVEPGIMLRYVCSFSLQRLNCILDHCSYVHGLALLLLC